MDDDLPTPAAPAEKTADAAQDRGKTDVAGHEQQGRMT
jgi:hypothetical protein